MTKSGQSISRNPASQLTAMFFTLVLVFATPPVAFAEDATTSLFSNLAPVEGASVAMAYIDPEADFSAYKRIKMLDTFVAFESGWLRNQRRGSRSNRVSANDMERIKTDVSTMFNEVLAAQLEADDGFEIVDETGDDVLLIRAAIIDLDVTAPDTMSAGRSRTFSASTGAATLYIELFDSVSGQIIGRAADRQAVRRAGGRVTWSNRVTNSAEARRMFTTWANTLRGFLDSHYIAE
jgi:hypothetical protein